MACKTSTDAWTKMFKDFDKDGNGSLCDKELTDLLKQGNSNLSAQQVQEMFAFFEGDKGDKRITLQEFLAGLKKIEDFIKEVTCLFKKYDADKSGCLNQTELNKVMDDCGHKFSDAEKKEIFSHADPNKDGKITLDEFLCLIT